MEDTKPIKRNFTTKTSQKGQNYFPINWYESYYPDMSHYGKTDWKPYSPSFQQPFHSLEKRDSYHRIKKLIDDNVATGVILYLKNHEYIFDIVDSLAKNIDIEIYPQIYNKYSGKNYPASKLESYKIEVLKNKNINVYFNDDLIPTIWTQKNTENFANIIRNSGENKYLMSCSALSNYTGDTNYLNDYNDIIAPLFYPLRKQANIKKNLLKTIPPFCGFQKFYEKLISFKKHIIEYNSTYKHQIYEAVTLSNYHIGRKNWAHVSRLPSYEEFRYQFFTAIICGAKGINIFANFACNEESYLNVKKIITDFRNSGVEKSILSGKYSPNIVIIENGKDNIGIDYCCYKLDKKTIVIISNNSEEKQNITLKSTDPKIIKILDFDTKLVTSNIYQKGFIMNPFEIKILHIWSK